MFNLHFTISTRVQPTLYLYRCSTYTLLSPHVFNLHSLSVQVFNLHFSLRQFQPLSLRSKKKTKGMSQPGTINIVISWGPEHRLRCHVQFSWPHFLHMNRINMHITAVKKQDRKCTHNEKLWRVRVTTFASEKQKYSLCCWARTVNYVNKLSVTQQCFVAILCRRQQ